MNPKLEQKWQRKEETSLNIISSLHDSILIHILSLMKNTKEAVQTCLLSRRWKNLWAFLPSLYFDCQEFESSKFFKQFVISVLLLRKASNVDSFRLYCDSSCINDFDNLFNVWIQHVLAHKPRLIFIQCGFYDPSNLPVSLFSCDSLEDLTLGFCIEGNINPRLINLPNLRKLSLGFVSVNDELVNKLLSLCPLLKDFELYYCDLYISEVTSNRLTHLSLVGFECSNMININTPNLNFLHLREDFRFGFSLKNMPSLYYAGIYLSSCPSFNFEFLSSISNVTELILVGAPLKDTLKRELPRCPKFNNLNELILDESFEDEIFDIDAIFLANSPNLDDKHIFFPAKEDNY